MSGATFSNHPTKTYKWGTLELGGNDGSIVTGLQRWFKTRAQAVTYGKEQFRMYAIARAWRI